MRSVRVGGFRALRSLLRSNYRIAVTTTLMMTLISSTCCSCPG